MTTIYELFFLVLVFMFLDVFLQKISEKRVFQVLFVNWKTYSGSNSETNPFCEQG